LHLKTLLIDTARGINREHQREIDLFGECFNGPREESGEKNEERNKPMPHNISRRHCEQSEANQNLTRGLWLVSSLRSSQ
jgi:hypothetical protein